MANVRGDEVDAIMQRLDHESAVRHERVRQLILAEGRPDLVTELDAKMRDIRLGIDGARSTWHSISGVQRMVLSEMERAGSSLRRMNGSTSYWLSGTQYGGIRLATVRSLASRELLAWEGGAFDPERVAVLTERGRFVVKHGPPRHLIETGRTPPQPPRRQ